MLAWCLVVIVPIGACRDFINVLQRGWFVTLSFLGQDIDTIIETLTSWHQSAQKMLSSLDAMVR
eukprot:92038-Amphidinium_carterae.1